MNTALATLRFLRLGRRRVSDEHEAADMGTCFGLEMSLQSEEAAAPAPAPAPESSHWWQRLPARRAPQA